MISLIKFKYLIDLNKSKESIIFWRIEIVNESIGHSQF